MKNRKTRLILILLLCLPLLLGLKILDIQLKNTDREHPLVNLDAIIKMGGDYVSGNTTESGRDPSKEAKETSEAPGNGSETDPSKGEEKEKITVRVMNKRIMINTAVIEPDNFEKAFKNVHKQGNEVILLDDYAEYHTFLTVVNFFNTLGVQYTVDVVK